MNALPRAKQELRHSLRARLHDPGEAAHRARAAATIQERVLALPLPGPAAAVGLYLSRADEVDTTALRTTWLASGRPLAVPVWNETRHAFILARLTADTTLRPGAYGILEPTPPDPVPIDTLSALLIPGLAFDRAGHRLGRGGGHFDRLLTGYRGRKIALAFSWQVMAEIPTEPHDICVDTIVTEQEVLHPSQEFTS